MENTRIKNLLTEIFEENHHACKDLSFPAFIKEVIKESESIVYMHLQNNPEVSSIPEEELSLLTEAISNKELVSAYDKFRKLEWNEKEIIASFKKDVLFAVETLCKKENRENGKPNQSIFLEHDYHPEAFILGYSEGMKEELYLAEETVDYEIVWKEYKEFESITDNLHILELLWNTVPYKRLKKAMFFKKYLLLHKTFDTIDKKQLEKLNLAFPFYVNAKEHDSEMMSIYVYEE